MQESRLERLLSCALTDPRQSSSNDHPVTGAKGAVDIDNVYKYEIYNASSSTTYDVKFNGQQTYHIACHESATKPDIIVYGGYDSSGPQLALGCLLNLTKNFEIYVGGLKNPDKDDWDLVRLVTEGSRQWSHDIHRFAFPIVEAQRGRKGHWTRTHDEALGASKLSSRGFKLVDEGSDEVLAVYLERVFHHAGDLRAGLKSNQTLRWQR